MDGMKFGNFSIRNGSSGGWALYDGMNYCANYDTAHELFFDLAYRFGDNPLSDVVSLFGTFEEKGPPFRYRGVCSELFWPLDKVQRYVYFRNTLGGIFDAFSMHKNKAEKFPQHFEYGVQGTGIHIFNGESGKYEFWVGGNDLTTIGDIMRKIKEEGLSIPCGFAEEYRAFDRFDVFISHNSVDFSHAKLVYDALTENGYKVFLSELSLPAVSNADYIGEINNSLEKSQNLIVIADAVEKISSGWVQYEWSSFLNEKLSGRKNGNLITLTTGIPIDALPLPLRQTEVIPMSAIDMVCSFIKV